MLPTQTMDGITFLHAASTSPAMACVALPAGPSGSRGEPNQHDRCGRARAPDRSGMGQWTLQRLGSEEP
jgi:hypothetical protein